MPRLSTIANKHIPCRDNSNLLKKGNQARPDFAPEKKNKSSNIDVERDSAGQADHALPVKTVSDQPEWVSDILEAIRGIAVSAKANATTPASSNATSEATREQKLGASIQTALQALGGPDARPEWVNEILFLADDLKQGARVEPAPRSDMPAEAPRSEARQKVIGLRTRGNMALRLGPVPETAGGEGPEPEKARPDEERPTTQDYEKAARESLAKVAEKRAVDKKKKQEEKRAEREHEKAEKAAQRAKEKAERDAERLAARRTKASKHAVKSKPATAGATHVGVLKRPAGKFLANWPKVPKVTSSGAVPYNGGTLYNIPRDQVIRTIKTAGDYYTETQRSYKNRSFEVAWQLCLEAIDVYRKSGR